MRKILGMKISNELKIGILAIVAVSLTIWGFYFLKGTNIIKGSQDFLIRYDQIDRLAVSDPVLVKGFQVGFVKDIQIVPDGNDLSVDVLIEVKKGINIPKQSIAVVTDQGITGAKAIVIEYSKPCEGIEDCAQTGDYLEGKRRGLIGSMLPTEEITDYFDEISIGLMSVLDTLAAQISATGGKEALDKGISDFQIIVDNLISSSKTIDKILSASGQKIDRAVGNIEKISSNIAENNEKITQIIENLDEITSQLREANLGNTVKSASLTMDEVATAVNDLKGTIQKAEATFAEVNNLINAINNGEGSLGKLMVNEELYENLEATSKHLELLLQDMRLNPKRYVNISVFGKKDKGYQDPKEDPGMEKQE